MGGVIRHSDLKSCGVSQTRVLPMKGPSTKEGWLFKSQTSIFRGRNWKQRYFAIRGGFLIKYRNANDDHARSQIPISQISKADKVSDIEGGRSFCFRVVSTKNTYLVAATTEEERDSWISTIRQAKLDEASFKFSKAMSEYLIACGSDEMQFLPGVITSVVANVPKYSNTRKLRTDLTRVLDALQREDDESSPVLSGNGSSEGEEPLTPTTPTIAMKQWQIPVEHLCFKDLLAEGFYGEVYRGTLWDKEVAIKRLKHRKLDNQAQQNIQKEVEVMMALRHPNVVLFLGFSDQGNTPCIVMEYCQKGTIYSVLREDKISDALLWKMVGDIISGMRYLHHKNVIHLDLKPLNMLVDDHYNVKITDFGLSRVVDPSTARFSRVGGGTILYMPLEVAFGASYGLQADSFSFGVCLFELLFLREHPESDYCIDESFIWEHLREPLHQDEEPMIPLWWPPAIRDVIRDCMDDDPEKRPLFDKIQERLMAIDCSGEWFLFRYSAQQLFALGREDPDFAFVYHPLKPLDVLQHLLESPDVVTSYYAVNAIGMMDANPENQEAAAKAASSFVAQDEFMDLILSDAPLEGWFQLLVVGNFTTKMSCLWSLELLLLKHETLLEDLIQRFNAADFASALALSVETSDGDHEYSKRIVEFLDHLLQKFGEGCLGLLCQRPIVDLLANWGKKSEKMDRQLYTASLSLLKTIASTDPSIAKKLGDMGLHPMLVHAHSMLRRRVSFGPSSPPSALKPLFSHSGSLLSESMSSSELLSREPSSSWSPEQHDRVAQNIRFQQARTRMEALANAQGLQSSVTAAVSREEVERMVTDEMVVDKLAEMLIDMDMDNISVAEVRSNLEREFEIELEKRKQWIGELSV